MSFQKSEFKESISKQIDKIQDVTLADNNIDEILENLNTMLNIYEKIKEDDQELIKVWNDIIADIISAIYVGNSGLYRLACISLRSILELACSSFFYYDHKIEYYIFMEHDAKADKYVSTLINDYNFYSTKYIKSFYKEIESVQKKEDSVKEELKNLYIVLCEIVHGKYKYLTKRADLTIEYNKTDFKFFEKLLKRVLSIIAVMYILRFNATVNIGEDNDIIKLANKSKVVQIDGDK